MKKRSDFADVESKEAESMSDQPTFESVNSHLDHSLTFARIAQAAHALGNQEAAEHAHAEVEKGYTVAVYELQQVQGLTAEQRHVLESKLEQLRDAVARLNQTPAMK